MMTAQWEINVFMHSCGMKNIQMGEKGNMLMIDDDSDRWNSNPYHHIGCSVRKSMEENNKERKIT